MGEVAALGGAILSDTGLSGSDRDDRVSREAVVSNNDVKKFGITHRMHSHAMLLLKDLLPIPYMFDNMSPDNQYGTRRYM